LISAVGIFFLWGPKRLMALYNSAYEEGTSFLLLAIPLFVLLANVLKFSDLADELYEIVHRWMGRLRGGLAMGTVVICAVFAAMADIYRSVGPFVILQAICLGVVMIWPDLALYLPSLMAKQ